MWSEGRLKRDLENAFRRIRTNHCREVSRCVGCDETKVPALHADDAVARNNRRVWDYSPSLETSARAHMRSGFQWEEPTMPSILDSGTLREDLTARTPAVPHSSTMTAARDIFTRATDTFSYSSPLHSRPESDVSITPFPHYCTHKSSQIIHTLSARI